jgi:hypothetical protein
MVPHAILLDLDETLIARGPLHGMRNGFSEISQPLCPLWRCPHSLRPS